VLVLLILNLEPSERVRVVCVTSSERTVSATSGVPNPFIFPVIAMNVNGKVVFDLLNGKKG